MATLEELIAERERRRQEDEAAQAQAQQPAPEQPAEQVTETPQRTPEEEAAFQEAGRQRVEAEQARRAAVLGPIEEQILNLSQLPGGPGIGGLPGNLPLQALSSALGLETRTEATEAFPEFVEQGTGQPALNQFLVAAGKSVAPSL